MTRSVRIDELIIDDDIEYKISHKKPPLAGWEVEEVVLWSSDSVYKGHDHPKYGWRITVTGTTYGGKPIIAYLKPVRGRQGVFKLGTAWVVK